MPDLTGTKRVDLPPHMPTVVRKLNIPLHLLPMVQGKDRKNFMQLELVHGVTVTILPAKLGDHVQEISLATDDPIDGASKCDDAANEIQRVSI